MSLQSKLDWDNVVSTNQKKASRANRSQLKDLRTSERQALNDATSAGQRREIKGYYELEKGKIIDVSINPQQVNNLADQNSDISQAGIDSSTGDSGSNDGGGGGVLDADGYLPTVLDYVSASNTAASGTFLIKT